MMPFGKEQTRRIYTTALVVSFLLIIGSIFLHLRQKTHLGRMSYNLDRDRIKPTSGVETVTSMDDYDSGFIDKRNQPFTTTDNADDKINNDMLEASSPEDDHNLNEDEIENNNGSIDDDDIDQDMDHINDYDIIKSTEENTEYELKSLEQDSSACLRCLCMTINECHSTFCGSGNPCGLYRISKSYWIDGGRPTISGGSTENEDQDYLTCVNEDSCSATVIRNYYNRYKRDCNKDGTFDCRDQIALHLLGPSGCLTKSLSNIHTNRMKNCLIESNLNYFSYFSEEEY